MTDLQRLGLFCQVAIAIMFAGSFIIGYFNLIAFNRSNTISTLKHLLDEYQALIKRGTFESYENELTNWKEQLATSALAPHAFYYKHLKHVSAVGLFYDYVGVMVKKRIVDFSLLFEVLPFPYMFWADTKDFRESMQEVTYANFWENFEYLSDRYYKERSKRDTPKNKQALVGKDKKRFKQVRKEV